MVIVKDVGVEPSVIVGGVKVTVAPGGNPVAESVIGNVNGPSSGAILKLKTAVCPGSTVRLPPLPVVEIVKLKSSTWTVTALDVLFPKFASPEYTAVITLLPTGNVVVSSAPVANELPRGTGEPTVVVPSRNVTVSELPGVPTPCGVTSAVRVTGCPTRIGVAEALRYCQ